ncbi:hypothetical protein [Antrihabitans cavernicola]|uniref:Uncharacterized protein n=1 Tax=Antrihabitans cavernicola TaxID=2495913 RepID=A0A5A7S968_9NOCA|nr:hypothetical protein [Spelaeibacter cavernicola]KAA0019478.1 hypothetical protein FOY51_22810 [Spelaeibacter cavernicola]
MTATLDSSNDQRVTVTIEEQISSENIELFYDLYEKAFGELRVKAAGRQVLHPAEFREEMLDARVMKYVSWSLENQPLSLTTLTNSLETVPWISPEYFNAKYPGRALYYLGFTLVRPDIRMQYVFRDIATRIANRMRNENAVLCLDMCGHHTSHGFDHTLRSIGVATGTTLDALDTQTFFAADFGTTHAQGDAQL